MPDFSLFGGEHVRQYEVTGGKVRPIMRAQWPDSDKDQASTKRDIPVVLLSPR